MTFIGLLVPVCWLVASVVGDPGTGPAPGTAGTNSSSGGLNGTRSGGKSSRGFDGPLRVDSSMIQRALYVLIGITVIGVLYFLVRAVRLKRPALKKKYGLLSSYEDSVEMEAVESEEDDTLYEARSLRR
ncbi:putative membrane protein C19orf24 [Liparis tanakae]|uniref:Putative membrane protein C19orf24 n=1 Tax=Liparis tanakae TaxID=230148 RepID=A0A4Z2EQ74_9TELE|nr:putative membrane protein C19orf24 [Liparis tanakae]